MLRSKVCFVIGGCVSGAAALNAAGAAKAKAEAQAAAIQQKADKIGGLLGEDVPSIPGQEHLGQLSAEVDGALAGMGEAVGNAREAVDLAKELAGYANAMTRPPPDFLKEVRREAELTVGLRKDNIDLSWTAALSPGKYNMFGAGIGVFVRSLRYWALLFIVVGCLALVPAWWKYSDMKHIGRYGGNTSMNEDAIEFEYAIPQTYASPAEYDTCTDGKSEEDCRADGFICKWSAARSTCAREPTKATDDDAFFFWFWPMFFDFWSIALVAFCFTIDFPRRQVKWTDEIKKGSGDNVLPATFTVKLSGLPRARSVSTTELTEMMQNTFGRVEYVTICVQNGEWNKLFFAVDALNKQIPAMKKAVEAAEATSTDGPPESGPEAKAAAAGKAKALRKMKKELAKKEKQLLALGGKLAAEEAKVGSEPCGGVAFVTFSDAGHAQECLKKMPSNKLALKNPCYKGLKPPLKMDGSPLLCSQAPVHSPPCKIHAVYL